MNVVGFIKIRNIFPVWVIVAIVGTVLCFSMLILTKHDTKPKYYSVIKIHFFLLLINL